MRLGSLFDGIGGWLLAAKRHDVTPVWASEIEKFPIQVTKLRFPEVKHLGDIRKIDGAKIDPVDIITFGSPCQDLSVAGKQEGLDGERSGLFVQATRIIHEMRTATNFQCPRFAVWENVPGAFSSNQGADFRTVLEEITQAEIPMPKSGRWATSGMVRRYGVEVAWRVLDAQYWGVPQRRKRIFLIADFGGQRAGEILFKPESLCGDIAKGDGERERTAETIASCARAASSEYLTGWDNQSRRIITTKGIAPTLSGADGGGGRNPCGYVAIPILEAGARTGTSTNDIRAGCGIGMDNDPMFTLQASKQHAVCAGFKQGNSAAAGGIGYQVEKAPTLTAGQSGTNMVPVIVTHPKTAGTICASGAGLNRPAGQANEADFCVVNANHIVRRLTPLECERLQGLPDGWTDLPGASDTARYKALGNGMAQPCADYIIGGIANVLKHSGVKP